MVARTAPGPLLGLFVVAGAVAAALAVRPRAGRMIFPVPVLSYMIAALLSGVVYDRAADASKTALAIAAAQWIANGFFAMALATVLAVAIISVRWYLWRRGRPATRAPGWPVPPTGPTRTGPGRNDLGRTGPRRAGTIQAGPIQTGPIQTGPIQTGPTQTGPGPDGAPRRPRPGLPTAAESGYAAGFAGPVNPRQVGEADGLGGPGTPPAWGDRGSRGTAPRPAPRPGSEPYNFSSGA